MQIVLQQQHAGLTATPRRALVRERNGWDPPGRPSMREEQVGGRQREEEDLWLVVYPTFHLISDAKRRRTQKLWTRIKIQWVRSLHEDGGKICWMSLSQVLPFCWYHDCSCPASLLYTPNSATARITHIKLEISAIQRIYEKYFTLVPPEITSLSSFICLNCQESVMLMRCTKAFG